MATFVHMVLIIQEAQKGTNHHRIEYTTRRVRTETVPFRIEVHQIGLKQIQKHVAAKLMYSGQNARMVLASP